MKSINDKDNFDRIILDFVNFYLNFWLIVVVFVGFIKYRDGFFEFEFFLKEDVKEVIL